MILPDVTLSASTLFPTDLKNEVARSSETSLLTYKRNKKMHPLNIRVKKNQLDAQLILSIFRQPLHVSGVSRPIIRRYNRMYTTAGTF